MQKKYGLPVLQKILDHFEAGVLTHTLYLENIGPQVSRLFVETVTGEYELYAFPHNRRDSALTYIQASPSGSRGILLSQTYQHDDQVYLLRKLAKKTPTTREDFNLTCTTLRGQELKKIFRVYGTILQGYFSDGTVFCSYGKWSVQAENERRMVSSSTPPKDIDGVVNALASEQIVFCSAAVAKDSLLLEFTRGYLFCFQSVSHFPAIEIRFSGIRHDIRVYDSQNIVYLEEF